MAMNEKVIAKRMRIKNKKRTMFIVGMLSIPILQFLIFFVYVNINTIFMAFQVRVGSTVKWSTLNFERFFAELGSKPEFSYGIRNSILFGLNDLLLLTISVVFSYFFYKKVRGSSFFRVVFFLPSIISIVIFVMVYKYMFNMGVVGEFLGWFGIENPPTLDRSSDYLVFMIMFYCLWVGTGYNILIMCGAMANLPEEVMEYSRLEGVGYFRELVQVVIPMIWPTIAVGVLGSITVMFTLFMQVDLLTQTGGSSNQATTIAFMINKMVKARNLEWAATLGVCFTVVAIPIIIIVRKTLDLVGKKFGG
jgi:ABC-type sugar transport system permease subunit